MFFDPFVNKIYDYANAMLDIRSGKVQFFSNKSSQCKNWNSFTFDWMKTLPSVHVVWLSYELWYQLKCHLKKTVVGVSHFLLKFIMSLHECLAAVCWQSLLCFLNQQGFFVACDLQLVLSFLSQRRLKMLFVNYLHPSWA